MKKMTCFIFLFTLIFSSFYLDRFIDKKVYASDAELYVAWPGGTQWVKYADNLPQLPNGYVPFDVFFSTYYIIKPSTGHVMSSSTGSYGKWTTTITLDPILSGFVPAGVSGIDSGAYDPDYYFITRPTGGQLFNSSIYSSQWVNHGMIPPIPSGYLPIGRQQDEFTYIVNPTTGSLMRGYAHWPSYEPHYEGNLPPIPNGFMPFGSHNRSFFIIRKPNSAPTNITIPAQTISGKDQTKTVNLASYFSDPDGDSLTYTTSSSTTANVSVALSGSTLTLRGVKKGSATITVTANDGNGGVKSTTFTTTVNNTAPTTPILTVPTVQFERGDTHYLNWNSTDPDGDALTYTLEVSYNNGSTWTTLYNGTNKTYTYTVPTNQTQVNFRVRAYDGTVYSAYGTSANKTIREVMHYWSKYSVAQGKTYTQGTFESQGTMSSSGPVRWYQMMMYGSYSFSSTQGFIQGSRIDGPSQDYVPVGTVSYDVSMANGIGYSVRRYVVTENSWSFVQQMYEARVTESSYLMAGNLIQANIQAGYNAYLHNQQNPDGFWWIRGQRVLAADTTPPIIELTEQATYGATSVVTVKTYDTSAVSVTKWAAGNQPASYFTTGGTNVSGGTFTATQNGVYTVYARDASGNASVQTIDVTKIDTIKPILVSTAIEGAKSVQGNKHWIKPGDELQIRLRGKDLESGVQRLYYYLQLTNGQFSRAYYDFSTNTASLSIPTEGWEYIDYMDLISTYDDGTEKEALLTIKAKSTENIHTYRHLYYVRDVAQNQIGSLYSGLDIQIDGQAPIGIVNQNSTTLTNGNVVITATGNDQEGSGMQQILLPNGSSVTGAAASYTVSANGTYSFQFVDRVGNVSTKSITVSNIDKTAPTIQFTPEFREADFKDIEVQTAIIDSGVSGYKQYRYAWTKDESYPSEGWSEWDSTPNPTIVQTSGGKWYLHVEAEDNAGNVAYASSGIYEKIVLSGGPSVTINVFPVPTGQWVAKPVDVYVMDSGDSELLKKASKYYEVTSSPLYPSIFSKTLPIDKKVQLNLQGENFIHIQYILDDGTKISATSGPYLIDTGTVGDFDMKLTNTAGVEVTTWANQNLHLVMSNPSGLPVSGFQKQYRIDGVHSDWQNYVSGTTITLEGTHRIFGRIVSGTGATTEPKIVVAKIDQTKPAMATLRLTKDTLNQYDVLVKADDALSGIKEVSLNSGILLEQESNGFEVSGLTAKPTSVTVQDVAGNSLSAVAFAIEPSIAFDAPYTLTTPLYRSDAIAKLTNATGYLLGNRGYHCTTNPCQVTVAYNTTLTAVRTEGIKETRTSVKISNIDQRDLRLMLTGKRNKMTPNEIMFSWNYDLTNAKITCQANGQTNTYSVTGKAWTLNGQNTLYHCSLSGNYKGIALTSESISVYADGADAVAGSGVTTNVYFEETRLGKSYIINAKKHNYKYSSLPIPQNEITVN